MTDRAKRIIALLIERDVCLATMPHPPYKPSYPIGIHEATDILRDVLADDARADFLHSEEDD